MRRQGYLIAALVCFGIAGLLFWVMVGQAQQSVNMPIVLQTGACSGGCYSNPVGCATNCGQPCTQVDSETECGWPSGYVVYRCCTGPTATVGPSATPAPATATRTATNTPAVQCGTCYGSQSNCNTNCGQPCVKVDAHAECGWGAGTTAYRCCPGPTRTPTARPTATMTATPRPTVTPGGQMKGGSVVMACADTEILGLSWWLTWSYPPSPAGCGGIGMVCCKGSTISYDAGFTGYLLGPNEANIAEQGNMTLQELVAKIRYIETQRPNGRIVSPGLFMYGGYGRPDYTYTYTDIVNEYRRQFGTDPRWTAIAVHSYGNDVAQHLAWIDSVKREFDALGIYLPYWVTEMGAWPGGPAETVMRGLVAGIQQRPWIERYAWFPVRPAVDSAGVGWDDTALLNKDGTIRALGRVYAGY